MAAKGGVMLRISTGWWPPGNGVSRWRCRSQMEAALLAVSSSQFQTSWPQKAPEMLMHMNARGREGMEGDFIVILVPSINILNNP